MYHLFRSIGRVNREEWGATATEYALLVSLIAVVVIGSVTGFGLSLYDHFNRACNDVAVVAGNTGC
jgi:Flp pilus assembly pilin Flp